MNRTRNYEKALLQAVATKLDEFGLDAIVESRGAATAQRGDARVTVRRDGKILRYRAEVKRALRPSLIGPIALAFAEDREDRLLITDYATPPLAELLRSRGIQFIDGAGNAYLKRRGLLVFVTGRRPEAPLLALKTLRVFRPSGLKAIFA